MKRIALISCTKDKQNYPCRAKEMYMRSNLFSKAYAYGKKYADSVYILSDKYGLLEEDDIIAPYNETLKGKSKEEKKLWGKNIINDLKDRVNLEEDKFIILAGKTYYGQLIKYLKYYQLPLEKLTIGKRLKKLDELLKEEMEEDHCYLLHKIFNSMKKYSFSNVDKIKVKNGIYVILDKYQYYCGMNRIVKVGTHINQGRLKNRLLDYASNKNKSSSIFRKNIGRAMLNAYNDPYISIWNIDFNIDKNKKQYSNLRDKKKEREIENYIDDYMKKYLQIVCFEVINKPLRLRLEEGIISTLNKEKSFKDSINWYGKYRAIPKMNSNELWIAKELIGEPLSYEEVDFIGSLCDKSKVLKEDKYEDILEI
ncbi:DUF6884 domain-containing protein [Clostridium fallax]|uniref:GIY-YIG nuclease family protein n=1 Tax=Clostridium fallax TaxID=1533 RepID=A0A1M4ZHL2_9CLOT|nr:DUF6884 domain-containing protein [Clostridium fallax]SHF17529.1 hypothetical protein SAMN05443638_1483 [Clostridium fallax]SQB06465.1 Uncharacterised protein [Clostridium fallax]